MGLTFAKKAAAPAAKAAEPVIQKPAATTTPTTSKPSVTPATTLAGWMKKGAAAKQAIAEDEAKAELAKQERNKLWRFWMAPDSERRITFLDGDLDGDGMLDILLFHEHSVVIGGERENFICTEDAEGFCPICERGDSRSALVGVMTVIDHTPHTIKSGSKAGQVIVNQRKLFVCKRESLKQLTKIAVKRGGLAGATFDVTRGNDKTAAVGNQFDFVEKLTHDEIVAKYNLTTDDVCPADYGHELTYRSGDELVALGVGKANTGPGTEKKAGKSLKDEL